MIRPAALLLVLALCLAATPAAAHWERTRWGMTPEAARALYPAATESGLPEARDPAAPVFQLQEPYVFDGQSFDMARLFFRDRGRLNLVDLSAAGKADRVPGLLAWLERRHGRPLVTEGSLDRPASGLGMYSAEYRAADGDQVVFSAVLWPNGDALVSVSFKPPKP